MAKLITIGKAAQILGKSDTYVRGLLDRGVLLPADEVQGTSKYPIIVLNEEHVRRLAEQPPSETPKQPQAVA